MPLRLIFAACPFTGTVPTHPPPSPHSDFPFFKVSKPGGQASPLCSPPSASDTGDASCQGREVGIDRGTVELQIRWPSSPPFCSLRSRLYDARILNSFSGFGHRTSGFGFTRASSQWAVGRKSTLACGTSDCDDSAHAATSLKLGQLAPHVSDACLQAWRRGKHVDAMAKLECLRAHRDGPPGRAAQTLPVQQLFTATPQSQSCLHRHLKRPPVLRFK